jgi:transposase-like protein
MITPKEQQVLGIKMDIPREFSTYDHKSRRRRDEKSRLREEHIVKLYGEGVSMAQIARAYNITRQRVFAIIKLAKSNA